jgi:hypothetical protein
LLKDAVHERGRFLVNPVHERLVVERQSLQHHLARSAGARSPERFSAVFGSDLIVGL